MALLSDEDIFVLHESRPSYDDGNLVMLLIKNEEYARSLEELDRLERRYLQRLGSHLTHHKLWLGWTIKVRNKLAPIIKAIRKSTNASNQ